MLTTQDKDSDPFFLFPKGLFHRNIKYLTANTKVTAFEREIRLRKFSQCEFLVMHTPELIYWQTSKCS